MTRRALDVIDAARAAAVLNPTRLRILGALREPGSASAVARQLGLARQKVNYHLRELEKAGFLEEVETRRAGNCIERIVRAKATHYLIQPQLLGNLAVDPAAVEDRFSASYLIALAAEAIHDVAAAQAKAVESKKRLATFSLHADVRFADAAARHAFSTELANAVARLVSRYHIEGADAGRTHRFIVAGYPTRKKEKED
ncbi:MAG TPA: helix-turn-helix domain-containing protein [Thermoanaerobaculia bacterium]|nr:helix-turn-helix domain-containing protein [Thermoanaerobaculia bacterium]